METDKIIRDGRSIPYGKRSLDAREYLTFVKRRDIMRSRPSRVFAAIVALSFLFSQATITGQDKLSKPVATYSVQKAVSSAGTEYRILHQAPGSSIPFHFMSIIFKDGAISIRFHPGDDVNGWGTSWYPQPFFPGAILSGAKVSKPKVQKTGGVLVKISGNVSSKQAKKVGTFSINLLFNYDAAAQKVTGAGAYTIKLSKSPAELGLGDLNICKIASNFLFDVPLLSGGRGNTGDASVVEVISDASTYLWDLLTYPGFFPPETTNNLSINVIGQYNNVDTLAQGYAPIAPALKPSVRVAYSSKTPGIPMIFGAIYDLAQRFFFWADNIGITPLILQSSTATEYAFDVTVESTVPTIPPPIVTRTITASAGAGGAISPNGAVSVNNGQNQTFTITPNAGYQINDVLVDGVSAGAVASYSFTNVTADHTIAASFKRLEGVWEEVSPPAAIKKIAGEGNLVCALSAGTLFFSPNNGNIWIPSPPTGLGELSLNFLDVDQGKIWVGCYSGYGVAVSTDGGVFFQLSSSASDPCMAVDLKNDYGWKAVASWGPGSGPGKKIPTSPNWTNLGYFSYQTVDAVTDVLDPANVAYFWCLQAGGYGGTKSLRTTDGGATWQEIHNQHVRFSSVVDGNPLICSPDQFSYDRGDTWQPLGFTAQSMTTGPDALLYAGTSTGVKVGKPGDWSDFGLNGTDIVSVSATANKLFAVSSDGKVFRTNVN